MPLLSDCPPKILSGKPLPREWAQSWPCISSLLVSQPLEPTPPGPPLHPSMVYAPTMVKDPTALQGLTSCPHQWPPPSLPLLPPTTATRGSAYGGILALLEMCPPPDCCVPPRPAHPLYSSWPPHPCLVPFPASTPSGFRVAYNSCPASSTFRCPPSTSYFPALPSVEDSSYPAEDALLELWSLPEGYHVS